MDNYQQSRYNWILRNFIFPDLCTGSQYTGAGLKVVGRGLSADCGVGCNCWVGALPAPVRPKGLWLQFISSQDLSTIEHWYDSAPYQPKIETYPGVT